MDLIFSRDEATLYEVVSVGWSDGWLVTSYFFGLLGATYAVYTALLLGFLSTPSQLSQPSDLFTFSKHHP